MAAVDLIQGRERRRGRGSGGRIARETEAEEQLLVFAIELQDLENAGTGLVQGGTLAHFQPGGGPEARQRGVQASEQGGFPLEQRGLRGPHVLLQEAVLFQGQFVKFVADFLVLAKRIRRRHEVCGGGVEFAGAGAEEGGVSTRGNRAEILCSA